MIGSREYDTGSVWLRDRQITVAASLTPTSPASRIQKPVCYVPVMALWRCGAVRYSVVNMANKTKSFTQYITGASIPARNALEWYAVSPASAFLTEAVHQCDAMNHCIRHFPKRRTDANYTKDSQDSLFRLGASTLAALMGHFELFQRCFFAGVFDATRLSPSFDIRKCCRTLEKNHSLSVDLNMLSSYRGHVAKTGLLIADSLGGWSDPEAVNEYLRAIVERVDFYSSADIKELRILWQLRHSIVHTAGSITRPDAQKVDGLGQFASRPIQLEPRFTEAVARRFHKMLPVSVGRYAKGFRASLTSPLSPPETATVDTLFRADTSRRSWL
jgi:hypothetical protein